MITVKLSDVARLRSFLNTDRAWADYALGDLEPELFKLTDWYGVVNDGAEEQGDLIAVAMIYRGLQPPICFLMGDMRGVDLILDQVVRLPEIGLSVHDEHLPVLEQYYQVTDATQMWKMALDVRDFRSVPGETFEITLADVPDLQALYAFGGGDAFSPEEIERGVFCGIRQNNQMIAVAGTHVVSDNGRIAALGNVMTHPDWRGRGLASIATSAVVARLIDRGVSTIGLSVSRENAAAIRVYEKLGFKKHAAFHEGNAMRRANA
ncbi:MAG: GNAT family N-acetyltransferase [Chloroflexi bacterium]|nr:GNAT family N-acetyltransferase [Chloroflexota bacterium]